MDERSDGMTLTRQNAHRFGCQQREPVMRAVLCVGAPFHSLAHGITPTTPPPMHPYEIKKNSQKKPICVYVRASGTRDKYTATAVARRTREPTTSKWYIIYDHQIVARRLYTRATSSVIVLYSHSTVVIKRAAAVSTPRLVHITPPPFILDMSPQLISMLRSSIVITAGLLFLGSAILVLISSTIL